MTIILSILALIWIYMLFETWLENMHWEGVLNNMQGEGK